MPTRYSLRRKNFSAEKMDSTNGKAAESPKKNIRSDSGDKAETDTDKVDDFKRGQRKHGGGNWKPR